MKWQGSDIFHKHYDRKKAGNNEFAGHIFSESKNAKTFKNKKNPSVPEKFNEVLGHHHYKDFQTENVDLLSNTQFYILEPSDPQKQKDVALVMLVKSNTAGFE